MRNWVASGVTNLPDVDWSEADAHLKIELKAQGLSTDQEAIDRFSGRVHFAVREFKAHRELVEGNKPAQVRTSLRSALELAEKLQAALSQLGDNARGLYKKFTHGDGLPQQEDPLSTLVAALQNAVHEADKYPGKGRLPEPEREWLAERIAVAMEKELELRPPSNLIRPLTAFFSIALEVATGQEPSDVSGPIQRVLAKRTPDRSSPT